MLQLLPCFGLGDQGQLATQQLRTGFSWLTSFCLETKRHLQQQMSSVTLDPGHLIVDV